MLLYLLLILPKATIVCDVILFADMYHKKETLLNNYGRPNNLILHKYTDTLFFSHTLDNGTHVDFEIIAYDFKKNTTQVIDVPGGYAIAYDAGNDDVYFGGHDGIYKYNYVTKKGDFFAEDGKSIWGLYVGTNFYYIAFPTQKLYVYQNDVFVQVEEALNIEIDNFYISKRQDIYYSNKTAIYKVEKSTNNAVILNDAIKVTQIVEDIAGEVYFSGSGGIYLEEKPLYYISNVAKIDKVYGMAFDDNDQLIYSDKTAIHRLLPCNEYIKCDLKF